MIRRAFQWGMILVLCREAAAGEEAAVWRLFRLADGSSFTARLIEDQEASYTISYSGSVFEVAKRDVISVTLVAQEAAPEPTKPWTPESVPQEPRPSPATGRPAAVPDERLFRAAIEDLAAHDEARTPQAILLLGTHLDRARPLLHQALRHRDTDLRGKVLKLLGAMGNSRDDLPALAAGLADQEPWVRLAAVQALRSLGAAAVKTPETPRDLRLVEVLVEHLPGEKDHEVRDAVRGALTELTGQKLGRDSAAWKAWLDDEESRGQAEKILREQGEGESSASSVEGGGTNG